MHLLLFLLILLRRPPSPTLFPYTTLFRSARSTLAAVSAEAVHAEPAQQAGAERDPLQAPHERRATPERQRQRERGSLPEDRKSTRLNSSHRCISYAVFCLKKKNTKYQTGI